MDKMHKADGESARLVDEYIDALRAILPDAFTEDGIDFEALRQLLGDEVADSEEKYGLTWHGKKRARQIALTPSTGTLRPCPEESVDWETTKNIFIEGDNLEVLKLMQKSYAGKISVIYIDPPYNKGKEFIYPDRFQDNLDTYLKYTGQKSADGQKFSSNTEASGRFHTNWLNMMYPRLKIARSFLDRPGVILISIDDDELTNLRLICDEVFGQENFVGQVVWEKGRKNDAKLLSIGHDYILIYAKDKAHLTELDIKWREAKPGAQEIQEEYVRLRGIYKSDNAKVQEGIRSFYQSLPREHPSKKHSRYGNVDDRGVWRDDNMSWPGGGGPTYDVVHPDTGLPCKVPEGGWRYSTPEKMQEMIDAGKVMFRADHTEPPIRKTYLVRADDEPDSSESEENNEVDEADDVGIQVAGSYFYRSALQASNLMRDIFGVRVFENPKDHEVLARWINYVSGGRKDAIVMDFFAGSGTTAHSVLSLNAKDNGNRSYILVQLPEEFHPSSKVQKAASKFCQENGLKKVISELTKQRLIRSATAVSDEYKDFDGDVGFKVFKLDGSNIRAWNPDASDLEQTLLDHAEHLVEGRSEQDVLYELLLKRGVDLTVPIEEKEIVGKTVYSIGFGVLLACLDENIDKAEIEALGQGIADWHKELDPAADTQVVFRDSAFADDIAKTNMAAILEQNGIAHVRSL